MVKSWKRIACAVDFSDQARAAMEQAAALAKERGASLLLVNVFEPPPVVTTDMLADPGSGAFEASAREVESLLGAWKADAELLCGREVGIRRLAGAPAAEVVKLARDQQLDLLVLGTHGRRGLAHLVLGSVAERVVREAPCAVLVVR